MPFYSVSIRPTQLQRARFSLLLALLYLLPGATAQAQVTFSGSGAVNFGDQAIGMPSAAQALTFSFASSTTVGSVPVVTQGAMGLDFTSAGTGTCTAGATYSAGASCTVHATFDPKAPGPRYGAAELLDSSGNVLATAYLKGTGMGPLANFLPGVVSPIVSGLNGPTGSAVDASGNLYITAGVQVLKETFSGGTYTQSIIYSGQSSLLGVAVDGSGNVYFVDIGAFKVYKATPSPGGIGASSWTDRIGHLWLYGGAGADATGYPGELNDLWVLDPSRSESAWMSGSSTAACLPQNNGNCGQPDVYGVLGMPAAGNVPGGRSGASSWADNGGNLWLFGGQGNDANGVPGNLNDLWEFEPPYLCDRGRDTRYGCHAVRDPRRHHWPESPDLDDF
jgi:hypothetical protein